MPDVVITLSMIDKTSGPTKKVTEEFKSLTPGLDKATKSVTGFIGANTALIGALTAVGTGLAWSVKQAAEAEKVQAQLNAVLESTSYAAGLSAEELDAMAVSLSRVSTFDDETIKKSEALLLTFTSIGKEVFPDAQQAILDMATAMGTDLQSATIQVGKAIQDPILGVSALRRVGVNFTEDQQKMIKTMVETGNVMEAQKFILNELSTEFGGQALAASKTYEGQMTILKNEIGNLGEAIGTELLPELTQLTSEIKDAAIWIGDNFEQIKKWGNVIMWVTNPLLKLGQAIGEWLHLLRDGKDGNEDLADSMTDVAKSGEDIPPMFDDIADSEDNAAKKAEEFAKKVSESITSQISLINSIQSAEESYTEKSNDLATERADILKEISKLRAQGYSDEGKNIQDQILKLDEVQLKEKELADERAKQSLQFISNILAENLARDGWTQSEFEAFAKQQEAWGLWSADVVEKSRAAWNEAAKITDAINAIPTSKQVTISIATINSAYVADQGAGFNAAHPNAHASGGTFMIPQSYGNEGFRLGNRDTASGGELISISPAGSNGMNPAAMQQFSEMIARAVAQAVEKSGGRR